MQLIHPKFNSYEKIPLEKNSLKNNVLNKKFIVVYKAKTIFHTTSLTNM